MLRQPVLSQVSSSILDNASAQCVIGFICDFDAIKSCTGAAHGVITSENPTSPANKKGAGSRGGTAGHNSAGLFRCR